MSIVNSQQSVPRVINFDSKRRISGSNSNFTSSPIELGFHEYDSVCLLQASIPKSFLNVSTLYNTFTLIEIGVPVSIVIPPNSYDVYNLIPFLITALNAASPNGWIYNVTYPAFGTPQDFRYTFTVTGNGINQPSFQFTNSMFRQIGFSSNSTVTFVGNTIRSATAINLAFSSRVYIKSNMVLDSNFGIIAEVLNYGNFCSGGFCHFETAEADSYSRGLDATLRNSWQFTLVNAFDEIVDLQDVSWTFSLVFYKRSTSHELHETELRLTQNTRLAGDLLGPTSINKEVLTGVAHQANQESILAFQDIF